MGAVHPRGQMCGKENERGCKLKEGKSKTVLPWQLRHMFVEQLIKFENFKYFWRFYTFFHKILFIEKNIFWKF